LERKFYKRYKIIKTPGHNYDGLTLLVKQMLAQLLFVGMFLEKDYPEKIFMLQTIEN